MDIQNKRIPEGEFMSQREEVLTQLSAVSSAITNVAKLVLEHHIDHCMSDVGEEYDETVEDLKRAIASFAKMK